MPCSRRFPIASTSSKVRDWNLIPNNAKRSVRRTPNDAEKFQASFRMKIRMVKKLHRFVAAMLLLLGIMMAHAEPLTIAVAANVKYAYDELAGEFNKSTGIAVQSVLGATGTLSAQVRNGAPYDVFISADTETPDALFKDGFAAGKPKIYAYGTLVLWTR